MHVDWTAAKQRLAHLYEDKPGLDGCLATTDRPRGWQVALRGFAGHPLHPPCTDATIGMFVLASGLAVIGSAGAIKEPAGKAMWLALIGGLIAAVPAATTGFVDWLFIEWGTARWRTATAACA